MPAMLATRKRQNLPRRGISDTVEVFIAILPQPAVVHHEQLPPFLAETKSHRPFHLRKLRGAVGASITVVVEQGRKVTRAGNNHLAARRKRHRPDIVREFLVGKNTHPKSTLHPQSEVRDIHELRLRDGGAEQEKKRLHASDRAPPKLPRDN